MNNFVNQSIRFRKIWSHEKICCLKDDGKCTKISYITEERLSRNLRILPSLVDSCRCGY